MRLRYHLSVIGVLVRMHMKAQLEHRVAFLLDRVAQILTYAAFYATLWILLDRFGSLAGWTWPQMAMLFSLHLLTFSLGAAFSFVQFRDLEDKVARGSIDTLLVLPFSPWAHIVFSALNIGYAGNVVLAGGMLVWAAGALGLLGNPAAMLYLLAAIVSGAMINAALITMIGTSALIFVRARHLFSIFFGFWELSRFPLSIYPGGVQLLLVTLVPVGFANFVPAASLLGKDVPLLGTLGGPLALLAGPLLAVIAALYWRFSLARYRSAGG